MTCTHKNRGFTLIEILIVLIILGILAAIVLPQFSCASPGVGADGQSNTMEVQQGLNASDQPQSDDNLSGPIGAANAGAAGGYPQSNSSKQVATSSNNSFNSIESASARTDESR